MKLVFFLLFAVVPPPIVRAQSGAADPGSLLRNGGGEVGAVARARDANEVSGWSARDGAWVAQRSPFAQLQALDGDAFLRPTSGDRPELEQSVVLHLDGAQDPVALCLRGFVCTGKSRDRAALRLELLDERGAIVAEADSGERAAATWTLVEVALRVPKASRTARVVLRAMHNDGDFADAYFDAVALEDAGPTRPIGWAGLNSDRLLAQFDDQDRGVRRAAMRALAVDPEDCRQLAVRWRSAVDAERKRELATAMIVAGGALGAEPLGSMIASVEPADRAAALALLPVAALDGAKILAPLLEPTQPRETRRAAIAGLLVHPMRDELRLLVRFVRAGPEDAALVFATIRSIRPPLDPLMTPLLAPALTADADETLRRDAMRVLGERGDARFLQPFAALAKREDSPAVLAQWCRWAAVIDAARAREVILTLVEERQKGIERALLAAAELLVDDEAMRWARTRGLAHEDAAMRRAAVRMLGARGDEADDERLAAACFDADPLVAVEAVEALVPRPRAPIDAALERLVERAPATIAAAALRALVQRAGGSGAERAIPILGAKVAPELRAAALEVLDANAVRAARDAVVAACADEDWRVRAAAYRALARDRDRTSVEALVARLDTERGGALGYLCDALVELTGIAGGDDAATWQGWWRSVASSFAVDPKPKPASRRRAAGATSTEYWGIPLRGRHFVFAIDLSGSMAEALDDRTRLDVAKARLVETLKALGPEHRFTIVGFGTEIETFERALVAADAETVERATKWVGRLAMRGATNIHDALETALAIDGVESIYLLTDGAPSAGKLVDVDEIRTAIRLVNRERFVRINTIQLGGGRRERSFLDGLARENHGESRRV